MIEFAKIYGEWNNYYGNHTYQKLTNAACYYGYNFDELAHDSLEDVKATLVVYNAIKKPPYVWMSMQLLNKEKEVIFESDDVTEVIENEALVMELILVFGQTVFKPFLHFIKQVAVGCKFSVGIVA